MFEVEFYRKRNGTEPMREHILSLPDKLQAKVLRSLKLLQLKGSELRYPDTDDVGDGIFELRTSFGNDIERALFFFTEDRRAIITHGFVKKTRRTPSRELRRAKEYRADYYAQKKEAYQHDHA